MSDYELLIPLSDVRDMVLMNVDGSRADLDDSGVSATSVALSEDENEFLSGITSPQQALSASQAFAWCVCSACSAPVKFAPSATAGATDCPGCGAALALPSQPHSDAATAAAAAAAAAVGDGALLITIATVDDVRLCLRAPTPLETRVWSSHLQFAIENNEERKRATC